MGVSGLGSRVAWASKLLLCCGVLPHHKAGRTYHFEGMGLQVLSALHPDGSGFLYSNRSTVEGEPARVKQLTEEYRGEQYAITPPLIPTP